MDPYADISKNVSATNEQSSNIDDISSNVIFCDDTHFSVTFHNGYGFRLLMEYVKTINKECKMIFDSDGIRFARGNEEGTIMIDVIIAGEELVLYEYSSSQDEYIVSFPMDIFERSVKQVSKKKSIRLFKNKNESDIYMQHLDSYKQVSSDPKKISTLSLGSEIIIPKATDDKYYIEEPIVVVPVSVFSKDCKEYDGNKCSYVECNISKSYVRLEGKGSTNKDKQDLASIPKTYDNTYGILNQKKDDNIYTIHIPIARIKSFPKLGIVSENSVIKFYRPKDEIIKICTEQGIVVPIKIVCSLNNYGIASIYLNNIY